MNQQTIAKIVAGTPTANAWFAIMYASDYRTPEAYSIDKGLVKQFPMFQGRASDLAKWARWAASATAIAEFPV